MNLLLTRRFGPLMATQFLSAFNDNLYRTAMIFLLSFGVLRGAGDEAAALATAAAGLFMLPFFLFSGIAGEMADAYDKARITRWIKFAEIPILGLGAYGIFIENIPVLMTALFLTGTHSAFFGPIKYAILPQHLRPEEVLKGTAWVEAGTFVAILFGQIAGGQTGHSAAAFGVVGVAVVGWLFALAIPPAPPTGARRPNLNPWTSSVAVVRAAWADRRQREPIIAISWFWSLGAVFTAGFVPLVAHRLYADADVATLFVSLFSVGVAAGSLLVNRLMVGEISGRPTPLAAAMLALFGASLYVAVLLFDSPYGSLNPPFRLIGIAAFVARPDAWAIMASLLGIAVAGGMFIVPLYALLQTAAGAETRSRAIAANNIINAAAMVAASLLSTLLLSVGGRFGIGIAEVLLLFALLTLLVAARLKRRMGLLTVATAGLHP